MRLSPGRLSVAIGPLTYALPPRQETNAQLLAENPDWRLPEIEKKTGVTVRYKAEPEVTAVDLAAEAAEKLFAKGVDRPTISALVLVTQSPDYALPSSACILQNRLKLPTTCLAFDVNLGCSGFVYGLAIGGSLIHSGLASKVLLVCAETYSKYIAASDRTCRPLFSDGASAALISPSDKGAISAFELGTDGAGAENLIAREGGQRKAPASTVPGLFMDGAKVFLFTMNQVPACVESVLKKAGKTLEDIDLFVFHQASKVVMDNLIAKLELPAEKVFLNYQRWGNTVSASLPMALQDALEAGKIRSGSSVMLIGFGVGYSWGGCLVEWP